MKYAYLDNASTTAMRPEVIQEMAQVMANTYGNPSSTHSLGRSAKSIVETSRKNIASSLNAEAREIIFTSCGTEANNWIVRSAAKDMGIKKIISSRIEHHSVLHSLEAVAAEFGTEIQFVNILPSGEIDLTHLVKLLSGNVLTLVSLMHVNNEIGTILDLAKVGAICRQHSAYFHTDTVQSMGKFHFDLKTLPVDFLVASAHKFHGPKGSGFMYVRKGISLKPIFFGGEQEKGLRAGTEAVHQIAGMAKALDLSYQLLDKEKEHVTSLKNYLIEQLDIHFTGYKINGSGAGSSLFYNIVNILLPFAEEKTSMILFHLDMKGIFVSRGSACQSGSIRPSHVLNEILDNEDVKKPSLRVSFCHFNTIQDVDLLIEGLKTV